MKTIIKALKSEIEKLQPIVDEYNELKKLLAQAEGNSTTKTENKFANLGRKSNRKLVVTEEMPEEYKVNYGLKTGDIYESGKHMCASLEISQPAISHWVKKKWVEYVHTE